MDVRYLQEYKMKKKIAAIFQIVLMIGFTIYVSYVMSQQDADSLQKKVIIVQKKEFSLLKILEIFNKIVWNENNLVSALELTDLDGGIHTCPFDKQGKYCQEYAAGECASKCSVACLPTPAEETATCKPGTCYDSNEGTCAVGAARQQCEESNGLWYNDPLGNVNVCRAGCCVIGDNALFITSQQCDRESMASGLDKIFRPEIKTELACLALSQEKEEGACVIEGEFENNCRFTTKTNCALNLQGRFYLGFLCSHPDLDTKCERQASSSCVDGKNEIYWIDSCGNRENIYDVNKVGSWNNGRVLSKNESCSLSNGNDPLGNQATCGNCNYFAGSVCGERTATQRLSESSAEFVCKDLSCVDERGIEHDHGESWCSYQGSVGLDQGVLTKRSTNPVGSRSFRNTCYEGSIVTDPCSDYNTEVCTQSSTRLDLGGDFTTAVCRTNRAMECYQYNDKNKKGLCTKNPDCSIKNVAITDNFKFDICTPKYTPGFDLEERGEGAAGLCGLASQKCQVVKVKKISGWRCVANCDCANTQKFAEQMNDACISLGDCGTKANYLGDLTVNHKVYKSRNSDSLGSPQGGEYYGLSNVYINSLIRYANELSANNHIDAANITEFYGDLGIPGTIGLPINGAEDKSRDVINQIQTINGAMGIAVLLATKTQIGLSGLLAVNGNFVTATQIAPDTLIPSSTVSGFAGAVSGAAIGFAVVSFLFSFTGVGRGLPPKAVHAMTAIGATAGAIIGYAVMVSAETGTLAALGGTLTGGFVSGLAAAATIAWILIIVIVIVIIVLAIFGIGKIRNEYVTFQCLPWQPPAGGVKCSECGSDGKICSKYACESLGQTCELINEESESPECANIAPNDISAPIIKINQSYFPSGYRVEENQNGARILANSSDGCLVESYSSALAVIDINEPAKCELMSDAQALEEGGELLSAGLFRLMHVIPINVPPLASLGLEDFNPDVRGDVTYHIRCEDKTGNRNINTYAINFCVKPGSDITPPAIVSREPYYEAVRVDSTQINASIFTNEPAQCRWSSDDKVYDIMENDFTCLNDFLQRELYGWRCFATLPFTGVNEKSYYVRCMDQPWISAENPANVTGRNANTESYNLKFNRITSPLTINYINLENETFEYNTTPASVEIILRTSGGLDGTAKCGYVWGEQTIEFFETFSREHRQVSPAYLPGEYEMTFKCEDQIGETAERTVNFEVKIDDSPPQITRAYSRQGTIFAVTDERATCYYIEDAGENCYFEIYGNSTKVMEKPGTLLHSIEARKGITYNIKCVDEFGHYPGECTESIRATL